MVEKEDVQIIKSPVVKKQVLDEYENYYKYFEKTTTTLAITE